MRENLCIIVQADFDQAFKDKDQPSMVLLSGGIDMRLKVWSAETGQCAITFTGHKGIITDTVVQWSVAVTLCSHHGMV